MFINSTFQRLLVYLFLFILPCVSVASSELSNVEKVFRDKFDNGADRTLEKIPVVVVPGADNLGKLTALSFIEWLIEHKEGVVALPVGKTPEMFIRYLTHYKRSWHDPKVQEELRSYGIISKDFPSLAKIKFLQKQEIFPISLKHKKSVQNYITKFYAHNLGIPPENLILMPIAGRGILKSKGLEVVFRAYNQVDWTLLSREPRNKIETWQRQALLEANQFCREYEERVKELGGIDLYIETIGSDGHLAFNMAGTGFDSKTRLVSLDYQISAHMATELGGIEFAKGRVGVTIGLKTATYNKDAKYILIAAGKPRANAVKNVVEGDISEASPASVFQKFPGSKVYVTESAAQSLTGQIRHTVAKKDVGVFIREIDRLFIDAGIQKNKKILELSEQDVLQQINAKYFLEQSNIPFDRLRRSAHNRLVRKLELGLRDIKAKNILHTGAYQDDILLGYHPQIREMLRHNRNYIAYFTRGTNAVSDQYIISLISRVDSRWLDRSKHLLFSQDYQDIIDDFARSYWVNDDENMFIFETVIVLKKICETFNLTTVSQLKDYIRWLKDEYFPKKEPGDVDSSEIIALKTKIRESEADRLWATNKVNLYDVKNFNLSFYSSIMFHSLPNYETDVKPVIEHLEITAPDYITVLDLPEGAASNGSFRAQVVLAEALRQAKISPNVKIIKYQNYGHAYHLADADRIVMATVNDQLSFSRAFKNCFPTQKQASFPSPLFKGDFVELTINNQSKQLNYLKTLIGTEYFEQYDNVAGVIAFKRELLADYVSSFKELDSYDTLRGINKRTFRLL